MKISLSRKDVDSGTNSGRMASPILPCGCLCSIPIPTGNPGVRYSDISFGKRTILELRRGLTSDNSDGNAHLDPDLRRESLNRRHKNWRAAFGQSGAAAGLLVNQGFTRGDLFIFFGWFRRTVVSGEGIHQSWRIPASVVEKIEQSRMARVPEAAA
jgi:Nucleotide modification associated domain 3